MNAVERLRAVLCAPDGSVVINGSDGDRAIIADALTELEAALTREAPTEGVSDPGRYFADGPQGHFFADDLKLARDLVNAYDKSDDWTITDLHNPTGEATPPAPQRMAQGESFVSCTCHLPRDKELCQRKNECVTVTASATQPPHQDRGEESDDDDDLIQDLIDAAIGLEGIQSEWCGEDLTPYHQRLADAKAALLAALTEAKQQGPGEADPMSVYEACARGVNDGKSGMHGPGVYPGVYPGVSCQYRHKSMPGVDGERSWLPWQQFSPEMEIRIAPQVEAKRQTDIDWPATIVTRVKEIPRLSQCGVFTLDHDEYEWLREQVMGAKRQTGGDA